MESATENRPPK